LSRIMKNVRMKSVASTIGAQKDKEAAVSKTPTVEAQRRIFFEHILSIAENRAEKIIAEAQDKGRIILLENEERAKQLRQEAEKEGFKTGYKEGKRAASKLIEDAEAVLKEAREQREAIVEAAEADILSLGLHLAEKIINHQLKANPTYLLAMLRASNFDFPGETVTIRANPRDFDMLQANEQGLSAFFPRGGYQIKADPKVEGGLILDTVQGTVDVRSQEQLKKLAKALGDVMVNG
jgi:flagellar assembly protein FliH